ncbi:MAG: large-conductance mechanosensitive channel protein MscL [Arenimonas sp.]
MGMVNEFKEFAMRGNVIDLAVGVVIGAAFGKIVSSLVDDLVMPLVGKLIGGVNFSDLALVLTPATLGPDGKELAAAVLLKYGAFLQSIINFLLIAFAVFMAIKVINRLQRKRELPATEPAPPAEEILLLTEIRDSLRSR